MQSPSSPSSPSHSRSSSPAPASRTGAVESLEPQILRLLARKDYVPLSAPELVRRLGLPSDQLAPVERLLRSLETSGRVARIKGDRFIPPLEADLIAGRIRMNRQGKGFLQPEDPALRGTEIVIPDNATGTALHEDRVLVRRDVRPTGLRPRPRAGSGGPPAAENTGTVIRILERRRTQIVGTLQSSRQFLFVVPDDPRIPHDIYVPPPRDVGREARVGDKVVVELREWQSRHTNPEGEVIEVLGAPDSEGVDMLAVLRQYQLPLRFPQGVLDEAKGIGNQVRAEELVGRIDCRQNLVVTIDPDDAKDFDDAIGLEPAGPDQWRLWVHIADVSHYVRPGSALDNEAQKRGNSTYLVDRVIPMLPEGLSNELCSLKPHVDRLTKCAEFLISSDGRVLKTKFYPAVIHSGRRFTYKEAFAALQAPPTDDISRMLHDAHRLAQIIRKRRFQNGSLNLDFPETKIRLDERGRVTRIEKIENDASHQLIEEFMLLANEAVAARLMHQRKPAVYRVHEEPAAPRLIEYRENVLAQHIPCGNLTLRPEVQKLLHRLDGVPIGAALKVGFLRSLKRACYSVEPLGHYGLAKAEYTHFTSPIRRYADLVVHRALFETPTRSREAETSALMKIADHLSVTERNSSDAERDSKDVKMFAFLRAQLDSASPNRYTAVVVEVRNFGLFIDVTDLGMSGLIHLSTVEDDFYVFDAIRNQLVGRRTRRVLRLGDRLEVEVSKVDTFKRQVDFRLSGENTRGTSARRTPARSADRAHGHGDNRGLSSRPAASPRRGRGFPPRTERPRELGPTEPDVGYRPRGDQDRPRPRPQSSDRSPIGRPQPVRQQSQPPRPRPDQDRWPKPRREAPRSASATPQPQRQPQRQPQVQRQPQRRPEPPRHGQGHGQDQGPRPKQNQRPLPPGRRGR